MGKYSSDYTDRSINSAQKLAEIACINRAKQMEVILGFKFWNLPDWKGYYFFQLKEASKLLKSLPESSLIKAAQQTQASSLRFGPFIAQAKKNAQEEKIQLSKTYTPGVTNSTGVFKGKKNVPEDL